MKKKCVVLVLLVFVAQIFISNFVYVEAKKDEPIYNTSICAGPSETMSLYFDFQNEMKSALLESEINERRFAVQLGTGGLFTRQVLTLTTDTAIDLLASNIWNKTRSQVSNTVTSVVLIALASASLAQSSTVGLAVLFRDRPIVRDYKKMMDIETDLFDVAYFRSQQINITKQVDGDMYENFKTVVDKYKGLGLLATDGTTDLKSNVTMVDIIWDLLVMNATMEVFIVYDSELVLSKYRGCMNRSRGGCVPVIKFSDEAIEKLKSDYKGTFGKCNSNFKESMTKIGASFVVSQVAGWQDVKNATSRLKQAFGVEGKSSQKKASTKKNKSKKKKGNNASSTQSSEECDISEYEISLITSLFGGDWTCEEAAELFASISDAKNKESLQDLIEQQEQASENEEGEKSIDRIKNAKTTSEKEQEWYYVFGAGCEFNTQGSFEMDSDFGEIYHSIMNGYKQSIYTAIFSDLSKEFAKIKALIEQIDAVEDQSTLLKDSLKEIADYQCAG